jgi:hypothetical protein
MNVNDKQPMNSNFQETPQVLKDQTPLRRKKNYRELWERIRIQAKIIEDLILRANKGSLVSFFN